MPDQNQPQQAPYGFGFGAQDGAADPIPYAGAQKLGAVLAQANNVPAAVQAVAPPPATLFGLRPIQSQPLRQLKQGSIIPGN
jgi:hypothetical protein